MTTRSVIGLSQIGVCTWTVITFGVTLNLSHATGLIVALEICLLLISGSSPPSLAPPSSSF